VVADDQDVGGGTELGQHPRRVALRHHHFPMEAMIAAYDVVTRASDTGAL